MAESLERAIALLTDGQAVDWEGLIEEAADDRERSLLEELRGLAQLDAEAVPSALDASVRWKGLALRYGTLAYPGFGSPIHRLALEVEAR